MKAVFTGARHRLGSRFLFTSVLLLSLSASGCSIFKTRPTQEMSDTQAAIKAAKEVQADVLAPELYRKANEWWRDARREYKFKNFDLAEEYAMKARRLAEQAEFEVVKGGAQRSGPPAEPEPAPTEKYKYDQPQGIPADRYPPNAPGGGLPTTNTIPGDAGGGSPPTIPGQ